MSLLGNVKVFLIAICAAVMFTILLVSANTMAMSVRERVREVGVLKTLGFTDGNVLGMILGEAISHFAARRHLSVFCFPRCWWAEWRTVRPGRFCRRSRPSSPRWRRPASLTAVVIGFISSLVPALGAARTPIVEALRSTD